MLFNVLSLLLRNVHVRMLHLGLPDWAGNLATLHVTRGWADEPDRRVRIEE